MDNYLDTKIVFDSEQAAYLIKHGCPLVEVRVREDKDDLMYIFDDYKKCEMLLQPLYNERWQAVRESKPDNQLSQFEMVLKAKGME